LAGFACSSPNLSLARQKEPPWRGTISASDPVSRAWYQRTQLPVLAWSSQAGGFFTERHSPQRVTDREVERVYSTPENWERRRRAQELGEQKGYTANQIALAWVLHQPFPTYAIIGPHSVEELRSSVVALEVELTPKETRWLDLEA
jgi:aryl-alcohol dehydrogenase-like predicted oxidoreductase